MNMPNESTPHKPGSSSTKLTTLYDLMEEINAAQCSILRVPADSDLDRKPDHEQMSDVVRIVYRMFETGRIRFMNIQDIKRNYAAWLI